MDKYEKILEKLFTTERATELLAYLDQLLKEPYLLNHPVPTTSNEISELKIIFENLGFKNEDFVKLKEVIQTATKVEIALPFIPDDAFVEELHVFFVSVGCKRFLLDIRLDETLFAGCTVAFNGKFIDAAIKPKINKFLAKK